MLVTLYRFLFAGLGYHAELIESCVNETLESGVRTTDIGGTATTMEFVQHVISLVKNKSTVVL